MLGDLASESVVAITYTGPPTYPSSQHSANHVGANMIRTRWGMAPFTAHRNPTLRVCPMPFDDVGDSIFADAEVAGDPTIALPAVDGMKHLRGEPV